MGIFGYSLSVVISRKDYHHKAMKENSTDYMTLPRLSIALVALLALGVSCTHRETGDDLLQPYELRYKASFRSAAPTWQKNDQMGVFSLSHGVV